MHERFALNLKKVKLKKLKQQVDKKWENSSLKTFLIFQPLYVLSLGMHQNASLSLF
jgi:hypothetical protein